VATQSLNRSIAAKKSKGWWSFAPWVSRALLILPTLIMIMASTHYIRDPSHAASPTGVTLSTPEALTDTRVVGGITLTIVLILASAIVSERRLRTGHAIVIALMALVLAVRMFGFAEDGTRLEMGNSTGQNGGRDRFPRPERCGVRNTDLRNETEGSDKMKTVIITGSNVGIGFATAKFLAAVPDWHVALACRNETKAKAAIRAIKLTRLDSNVSYLPLDLFSLASVRRFPTFLTSMNLPSLGGLILNAGGINMKAKSLEFSEDGFERTFQLNFLGHFLLVNLLVNQMTEPGRIVFVSSDLHDPAATKMGKIMPPRYGPVDDLAYGTGTAAKLKPMARYATAKMYAMMAAYEFDRKLRRARRSTTVNSWSPGVVPTTQAGRDMNPMMKKIMMSRWFVGFMGSHLSTEEEAAQALGRLVVDAKFSGVSGRYFDGFKEIPSSIESRDETKAGAVWDQSVRLAGLSQEEDAEMRVWPVPGGAAKSLGAPAVEN
jgi:NAD(P)-dependent dehydrogenase (short-subunit alcohol dehydrogenase family)